MRCQLILANCGRASVIFILDGWLWCVSSTMKRNSLWFSKELARGRNIRGTAAAATCWSLHLACVSCKFFDRISRRCEPERPPFIWDRSCFCSSWSWKYRHFNFLSLQRNLARFEGISPVLPPLQLQYQDCNRFHLVHASSVLGKRIYRWTHLCEPKYTLIKSTFAVHINKSPEELYMITYTDKRHLLAFRVVLVYYRDDLTL